MVKTLALLQAAAFLLLLFGESVGAEKVISVCNNVPQMVKVRTWLPNGTMVELLGVTAAFGGRVPSKVEEAQSLNTQKMDTSNGCNVSHHHSLGGRAAVAWRGDCLFVAKAAAAQLSGAAALLVINSDETLFTMSCTDDDPDARVAVLPTVMLPKSAELVLGNSSLADTGAVTVAVYSPPRHLLDPAELVLWLMAVATVVAASYWSASEERRKFLQRSRRGKKVPRKLFAYTCTNNHNTGKYHHISTPVSGFEATSFCCGWLPLSSRQQ
eukprot:jgi/Mesen1/5194/ME000258S04291